MKTLRLFVLGHQKTSIAALLLLALLSYFGYTTFHKSTTPTTYQLGYVEKGTLIVSLSGSGQVSAGNQVEISPRVSGDITSIVIKNGQEVKKGAVIATIDARDAQKAVRDAEVNLESANLSLQKLVKPADSLSIIQSENALARASENKVTVTADLDKAYDDGFNAVSNAFLELPPIIAGLQDALFSFSTGLSGNEQNIDFYASAAERYDANAQVYRKETYDKYQAARTSYDATYAHYKTISRTSSRAEIEAIIGESYDTTKLIADANKSANNLIQFYKDKLIEHNITPKAYADTQLTTLAGYTAKTNTHLGTLLNAAATITSDKDAIVNAERTITEQTASLEKLKSGADTLDISSTNLTIKQRENALRDAREKLSDYTVRAPFAGTIAKVNAREGDAAGPSIATLITRQKIAEIALNEIDAAKVKVGQKSTLVFDAVSGLTITGEVAEVDAVGAVTQGVVTYGIKISFDTDDARVKPGMSVSATIITEVKQDVLLVPSSAVTISGTESTVNVFEPKLPEVGGIQGVTSPVPPVPKIVTIGSSNDTSTEIIEGLLEGEQIVVRTIVVKTTTTATAPSLFGGGALRGR
jgi:RND family efflux transporter MFP subunit